MKLGVRFFLSWIVAAVVMFLLFYLWHGIILNDLKRLQFPLSWFITFAALTYLILGAGIYFLYESSILKRFTNFILRGLITGLIAGLVIFMIATIVNISITKNLRMQHMLVNCAWQITEQVIGAMVPVIFKIIIFEPQSETA